MLRDEERKGEKERKLIKSRFLLFPALKKNAASSLYSNGKFLIYKKWNNFK